MHKQTFYIKGMHCPSCEVLVKDKFKLAGNVVSVNADFRQQKAEVISKEKIDGRELNQVNKNLMPYGYLIVNKNKIDEEKTSLLSRVYDAGSIAVFLFILYYFAEEFNLIPRLNVSSGLTLGLVFLLGIVASTSTCMATTGALFMTTIGRLNNSHGKWKEGLETGPEDRSKMTEKNQTSKHQLPNSLPNLISNFFPSISFNLGRILSYGFFGFIFGMLGKAVSFNPVLSSILTLVVSAAMIFIGLDMLKIVSFSSLSLTAWTTRLFEKIDDRLLKNPKKTSFFIGASTYLLPCGFTQTVQLYAVGLADPVKSAMMMMTFALGTMPLLMIIGLLSSSFAQSKFYLTFQKVIAVIIVIIGLSYFGNFLSLNGVNIKFFPVKQAVGNDVNVKMENGVQVVRMTVDSSGYRPNLFTIKKGIPVRWLIDGKDVYGCQGFFVVPSLGVQRTLQPGENVIEFTPDRSGTIGFSCGMGMYRGRFEVI